MILYQVPADGVDNDYWFTNLKDALIEARSQADFVSKGEVVPITKVDIGKLDKAKAVLLLEHQGFAISQTTVANIKGKRDDDQ